MAHRGRRRASHGGERRSRATRRRAGGEGAQGPSLVAIDEPEALAVVRRVGCCSRVIRPDAETLARWTREFRLDEVRTEIEEWGAGECTKALILTEDRTGGGLEGDIHAYLDELEQALTERVLESNASFRRVVEVLVEAARSAVGG